ncbi:partitioning defective 3 homolog [Gigantopelta aegis]|uniref:partitioning defective 3 homolog n=1 Tax=Gigantopelta aegis TaxID=1735272 RepID=UPI001B887655|nr:partitioning defective 3 homolog [Gigantopelta aegis]
MPMKVTVCFDRVRVIVPCGEGELPVRDLIQKAITRYKKATGKANNYWVSVHYVKTLSGGGILDPDDTLNDVVDDREQLIADFEEQGRPGIHHNGGDGASASSTGTASPDIFQGGEVTSESMQSVTSSLQNGKNDIVVTARELLVGSNLKVRRGSEPALNTLGEDIKENGDISKPKPPYRVRRTKEDARESDTPRSDTDSEEEEYRALRMLTKKPSPVSNFSRDSVRQSLSNRPEMFRWLEAQEKQQAQFDKKFDERTAPVGGNGLDTEAASPSKPRDTSVALILKNDGGPLGIHVIPDLDDNGRELGLMIQSIEQGGKIQRDGRLQVRDRITEINGVSLFNVNFDNAQIIFRDAMKTTEIQLRVVKYQPQPMARSAPQTMPKPKGHTPVKPSPLTLPAPGSDVSPVQSPNEISPLSEKDSNVVNNNKKNINVTNISSFSNIGRLPKSPLSPRANMPIPAGPPLKVTSPTKKTPPAVPARHPSTTLSAIKPKDALINLANTRKIGKKISIDLIKGPLGLGFSVTSRDNPTSPQCPIYIKNILPEGAAVSDGRLKSGDRLLEVNGVEMTGKSQAEAVAFLRKIATGNKVNLVVSRQEAVDEMFQVPRELTAGDVGDVTDGTDVTLQPPDKVGEDVTLTSARNKEVITLEIPLNDSGSAGLGVSVKGKTTTAKEGSRDLGIFIKSVMTGGAASKDGRLLVNDQLLEVNGTVLSNLSNMDAMNALRQAMQTDGPVPGYIIITVARKIGAPSPFHFSESSSDNMDTSQPETIGHGLHIYSEKTHTNNNTASDTVKVPKPKERKMVDVTHNPPVVKPHNKMLDRLLAADVKGLRNESYTRALRDNFQTNPDNSVANFGVQGSTVAPSEKRDVVIVEDDMYAIPRKRVQPTRPHSTLGIPIRRSPPDSHSSSFDEFPTHGSHSDHSSDHQETELSPTGDFTFDREGFGRQSMSEKRKGHLDPRQCEFYQRAKEKNKEIKAGLAVSRELHDEPNRLVQSSFVESLSGTGQSNLHDLQTQYPRNLPQTVSQPTLKRASSLEDLSVPDKSEEEKVPMWHMPRMGRQRACNDSFRAAVDRSYDPQGDHNVMDTPITVEEESLDSGSVSYGQSNSARSSFSSENTGEAGSGDFHSLRKKKHKEKKGGILKGFLRFGRGRKSNEENNRRSRSAERPQDAEVRQRQIEEEERASKQSKDDQFRPREDQRVKDQEVFDIKKLREEHQRGWDRPLFDRQTEKEENSRPKPRTHMFDNQKMHLAQQMFYDPQAETEPSVSEQWRTATRQQQLDGDQWQYQGNHGEQRGQTSEMMSYTLREGNLKRADKIQLLRAEHQRRHQERQGRYPLDEREEIIETALRQAEEEKLKRLGQNNQEYHPSSRGYQPR